MFQGEVLTESRVAEIVGELGLVGLDEVLDWGCLPDKPYLMGSEIVEPAMLLCDYHFRPVELADVIPHTFEKWKVRYLDHYFWILLGRVESGDEAYEFSTFKFVLVNDGSAYGTQGLGLNLMNTAVVEMLIEGDRDLDINKACPDAIANPPLSIYQFTVKRRIWHLSLPLSSTEPPSVAEVKLQSEFRYSFESGWLAYSVNEFVDLRTGIETPTSTTVPEEGRMAPTELDTFDVDHCWELSYYYARSTWLALGSQQYGDTSIWSLLDFDGWPEEVAFSMMWCALGYYDRISYCQAHYSELAGNLPDWPGLGDPGQARPRS